MRRSGALAGPSSTSTSSGPNMIRTGGCCASKVSSTSMFSDAGQIGPPANASVDDGHHGRSQATGLQVAEPDLGLAVLVHARILGREAAIAACQPARDR